MFQEDTHLQWREKSFLQTVPAKCSSTAFEEELPIIYLAFLLGKCLLKGVGLSRLARDEVTGVKGQWYTLPASPKERSGQAVKVSITY